MKVRLFEYGYKVTTKFVVYRYISWVSELDRSVENDLQIIRITLHRGDAITTCEFYNNNSVDQN